MISVCIPAYNEQETIEACIESILTQQKTGDIDSEIVVCNDASSDQTGEIIDSIAAENEDVTAVHNETNRGMLGTTQRCFDHASGDIIFRLDADSTLKPDSLEALKTEFDGGVDIVYGKVHIKNTDRLHPAASQLGKKQGTAAWYGGACVAIRRQVIEDIGGFDSLRQNVETELMNYAAENDIEVVKTPDVAIDSVFPVTISEWLPRKYNSGRFYIRECANTPGQLDLRELRGPIAWTGIGLGAFVTPLLSLVGLLSIFVVFLLRVPKLSSITTNPIILVLYPFYMMVGGIARTIGVYRTLPLLLKTLWGKYA